MIDLKSEKLAAFVRSIDFEAVVEPADFPGGVAARWPSPVDAPALADAGFRVLADTTLVSHPCAIRRWVLGRGRERVIVAIAVSSRGPRPIHERFFVAASAATTLLFIPYAPAFGDLGTLAVGSTEGTDESLLWLYRNVFFEVSTLAAEIDVERLARFYQGIAEAHAVDDIARFLPAILALRPAPARPAAGQAFEVECEIAGSGGLIVEADFETSWELEGKALELLGAAGRTARLRARQEGGRGVLQAVVLERASLLLGTRAIEIDVARNDVTL